MRFPAGELMMQKSREIEKNRTLKEAPRSIMGKMRAGLESRDDFFLGSL